MSRCIDLNCDMGEGFDSDESILPYVTSVNIACGAHAGDAATMRETVRLAIVHGVAIGAHPGFADRDNFGRREMHLSPEEVHDLIQQQVEALAEIARAAGGAVTHLKPHGALYNMASRDAAAARAIAQATRHFDPACILVGLAGSELIQAGETAGLTTASEAFADRNYEADRSLTPRTHLDALIHDPVVAAARAVCMVLLGTVRSRTGTEIPLHADTICIHGDSPSAALLAKTIHEHLTQQEIEVKAFARKNQAS